MIETIVYFTQVERAKEGSIFLATGLTIAERMDPFHAWLSLRTLTYAFHQTLKEQSNLIAHLTDAALQEFSPAHLTDLAGLVEQLIACNQRVLLNSRRMSTRTWRESLATLASQSVRLETLAESLRLASDEETQAYIRSLVASSEEPENHNADFDWRNFVASLQD